MLDLVGPVMVDKISLSDLKTCKQAYIFFDTMFNLEKYLDHEQRDPFANTRVCLLFLLVSTWELVAFQLTKVKNSSSRLYRVICVVLFFGV